MQEYYCYSNSRKDNWQVLFFTRIVWHVQLPISFSSLCTNPTGGGFQLSLRDSQMEFEASHLYLKDVVGWISTVLVSPSQASVSAYKVVDIAVSGTKAGDLRTWCVMNIVFPVFMVCLCDHPCFISYRSSLAFPLSLSSESMMEASRASAFLFPSLILLTSSFLFWSQWSVIYLQPLPELNLLCWM